MSRTPLFFTEDLDPAAGEAVLKGGDHDHLSRVLRLREGDTVLVSDGRGAIFRGMIRRVAREWTRLSLEGKVVQEPGSNVEITLIQALPKHRKMEWILQKATELGVCRIVPVTSKYSVPRWAGQTWRRKKRRWEQIVREAAKQSYRAKLPSLGDLEPLEVAMAGERGELNLFFTTNGGLSLKACLEPESAPRPRGITVVVGPEGGFSPEENAAAGALGYHSCSLGPGVLRVETAVIKVLAILQYTFGEG